MFIDHVEIDATLKDVERFTTFVLNLKAIGGEFATEHSKVSKGGLYGNIFATETGRPGLEWKCIDRDANRVRFSFNANKLMPTCRKALPVFLSLFKDKVSTTCEITSDVTYNLMSNALINVPSAQKHVRYDTAGRNEYLGFGQVVGKDNAKRSPRYVCAYDKLKHDKKFCQLHYPDAKQVHRLEFRFSAKGMRWLLAGELDPFEFAHGGKSHDIAVLMQPETPRRRYGKRFYPCKPSELKMLNDWRNNPDGFKLDPDAKSKLDSLLRALETVDIAPLLQDKWNAQKKPLIDEINSWLSED